MYIDKYKDSYNEKIAKIKNMLESLLNTNVDVILYQTDPRVENFNCFANVENFDKIKLLYPDAKVNDDSIYFVINKIHHISATVHKVDENNRQEKIDAVIKKIERRRQEDRERGVKY